MVAYGFNLENGWIILQDHLSLTKEKKEEEEKEEEEEKCAAASFNTLFIHVFVKRDKNLLIIDKSIQIMTSWARTLSKAVY